MEQRKRVATRFIIGIGLVSLFADMTYEGGRSITGPFLASLGAGPLLVGAVAGIGEFISYGVRWFSGRYADRSGRHWLAMAVGYTINLLAVPALALASGAGTASALIFAERLGKGVRNPPRDAVLARAGEEVGQGRAFGLHELLDQLGALIGPVLVALLISLGGLRVGFAGLLGSALLALAFLVRARGQPAPPPKPRVVLRRGYPPAFYAYLAFSAVVVLGFAHFQLVAYRMGVDHLVPVYGIPLIFAVAMGADALAAYLAGLAYDRFGLRTLAFLPPLCLLATPLFFLAGSAWLLALAAVLWGAALGLQESLMRSGLANLIPEGQRGAAYGLFDSVYGAAWLIGSVMLGALDALGVGGVVAFSLAAELASIYLLVRFLRSLPPRAAASGGQ